ncbi:uncharacterized protein LOC131935970 [Physella acuta]|uniref:uncharacterized protein LOC131935970 n=1 Tax=Physella acuta TaxID=109671 RepID=UPI0027DBB8FD|nr:uncharacterized protein LOC131935970 [Physella acuta]
MTMSMMALTDLFIVLIAIVELSRGAFGMPLHASCKIDWYFGLGCPETSKKIIDQIDLWKGNDCGTGEKCKYKFISFDNSVLKATHTTPVKNYVDDLTFVFNSNSTTSCVVNGFSTSETWYAVLDYGTNYCNLHNLITGSGLDLTANYKEATDNGRCTQYSSANCDKY